MNLTQVTQYEIEQMRRLRRIKELSQSDVGKCIGVTKQYISNIERGARDISREQYNSIIMAINSLPNKSLDK